jgi:hypothetical protein
MLLHRPRGLEPAGGYPAGFTSDSCACGGHIVSALAVQSALFEFVERQSLIASWLSCRPARRLDTEVAVDRDDYFLLILKEYLEHVALFEISLSRYFAVVLVLGWGRYYMAIGASAGFDIRSACQGALRECVQMLSGYLTLKRQRKGILGGNAKPTSSGNYYVDHFYGQYWPTKLRDEFGYLFHDSDVSSRSEYDDTRAELRTVDVFSVSRALSQELKLDLLLVFIPGLIRETAFKCVRLYSKDAFPHLRTDLYDPEAYAIGRRLNVTHFPNARRMIPFP